jgi:ribosomal protein S18 acetylase RimI-like enzyme
MTPSAPAPVVHVRPIDLSQSGDQHALLTLLDAYARDPMGGGTALSSQTRSTLVAGLQATPSYRGWLAWEGSPASRQGPPLAPGQPLGLLNAFLGYSTFAAAPLLNVHDLAVLPEARGRGVGRALLRVAEAFARHQGCCKLTLEVLEGNRPAQGLYTAEGYAGYSLDPQMGRAMFWQKKLA